MGKSKRTKKFLQKKTNLTHKVRERKKRQNTKRKREDRKFEKEQRKNAKRVVEEEEDVSNEMDESKMSKMGLDEFLSGGFMNSDGENDDLVEKSKDEDEEEDKEDDVKSHRAELEALKKQDPEFYEYLKKTDAELLDFGAEDDDEEEEEEDDEALDEEEADIMDEDLSKLHDEMKQRGRPIGEEWLTS